MAKRIEQAASKLMGAKTNAAAAARKAKSGSDFMAKWVCSENTARREKLQTLFFSPPRTNAHTHFDPLPQKALRKADQVGAAPADTH